MQNINNLFQAIGVGGRVFCPGFYVDTDTDTDTDPERNSWLRLVRVKR